MTQNTVFIVGAGASQEANLPTGEQLIGAISRLLDMHFESINHQKSGDHIIVQALRMYVKSPDGREGNINSYIDAALHISEALPQAISIDNFIYNLRGNDKITLCGKLAIVRSILEAENNSLLYFKRERIDSNINFSGLEKSWYKPFFQLLTENCDKSGLEERFKFITFIIFNYDRCIEHFIYYALQNYYRFTGPETAELIKNINIYHPYGDVGALPWVNQKEGMDFGAEPNPKQILEQSRKINTFTESLNPKSSDISGIRERMGLADRVVFLGFAFHPLNMQLITPGPDDIIKGKIRGIKYFATTYQTSKSNQDVIKQQIKNLNNTMLPSVELTDKKCYDFFIEYWKSLSF